LVGSGQIDRFFLGRGAFEAQLSQALPALVFRQVWFFGLMARNGIEVENSFSIRSTALEFNEAIRMAQRRLEL